MTEGKTRRGTALANTGVVIILLTASFVAGMMVQVPGGEGPDGHCTDEWIPIRLKWTKSV